MPKFSALHLMNDFADSSISRIIQSLAQHQGCLNIDWHVGGFQEPRTLVSEFTQMGIHAVDFSQDLSNSWKQISSLRSYIHENDITFIHTHTPRAILMTSMALGKGPNPFHLATKHILYRSNDRPWGEIYYLIDRLSLYTPDHLIAVSSEMKNTILSLPLIKDRDVTVVRNAINFEQYYCPGYRDQVREEFGINTDTIIIGFTGRIAPAKNLDMLFKAFARVIVEKPNLHLILIGRGDQKTELEKLAAKLNITNAVSWAGFRRDIPHLLAGIDIFIQPSSNEGLSLSLLEAMAAEKPVIATDVGGTSEVVLDRVTGLLIPTHSVTALKSSMLQLLDDESLRIDLARTGRKFVMDEFDIRKMIRSYWEVYEKYLVKS
jgi:glycosyltransferase involved in cell wall biosynthesis